ncbi:MAG: DUF2318 domain-containing protein, partial [Clostridiales Family XIII bacterium]|nr:DUF2318 domain-containing protein [Clostridiales Family XIII bacterium]
MIYYRNNQEKKATHGFIKLTFIAILMLSLLLAFAGCANDANSDAQGATDSGDVSADADRTQPSNAPEISAGESLVIPLTDISETAAFYPISVGGTTMEVLAVKAPDGTIRTAFNTCEVCYDSGQGYYKQEGNVLVCQNCGNRFETAQVEVQANGCNPWPIFAEDKTVTDESITISYDFLAASTQVFAN